jgi:hypothetical protein
MLACPTLAMAYYKARAAIRRPRIPAVEAPIWMLLAPPVEEADAAEADEDPVSLPDAADFPEPELKVSEMDVCTLSSSDIPELRLPELLPVAEAELLAAPAPVPVAPAAPVVLKKFELMQEDWQAPYALVSSADPLPWLHFIAHSVVALT